MRRYDVIVLEPGETITITRVDEINRGKATVKYIDVDIRGKEYRVPGKRMEKFKQFFGIEMSTRPGKIIKIRKPTTLVYFHDSVNAYGRRYVIDDVFETDDAIESEKEAQLITDIIISNIPDGQAIKKGERVNRFRKLVGKVIDAKRLQNREIFYEPNVLAKVVITKKRVNDKDVYLSLSIREKRKRITKNQMDVDTRGVIQLVPEIIVGDEKYCLEPLTEITSIEQKEEMNTAIRAVKEMAENLTLTTDIGEIKIVTENIRKALAPKNLRGYNEKIRKIIVKSISNKVNELINRSKRRKPIITFVQELQELKTGCVYEEAGMCYMVPKPIRETIDESIKEILTKSVEETAKKNVKH